MKDCVKTVVESLGWLPIVTENHLYRQTVLKLMESLGWLPVVMEDYIF